MMTTLNKMGKFITIEGTEGVGKTTNIEYIKQRLTEEGIDFVATREPGGTPLAEQIRTFLLTPHAEQMDPTAELLMIFAARAQHLCNVILPALRQGKWVLCDRFTDATYAYQGGGRQMDKACIQVLEQLVQQDLRPDAVILLDVPVEVGLTRAKARGTLDRFEREDIEFFERVRQVYLERARINKRYHVVDAGQSLEKVQAQLQGVLQLILSQANG